MFQNGSSGTDQVIHVHSGDPLKCFNGSGDPLKQIVQCQPEGSETGQQSLLE